MSHFKELSCVLEVHTMIGSAFQKFLSNRECMKLFKASQIHTVTQVGI